MDIAKLREEALAIGFTLAEPMRVDTIHLREEVREMCADERIPTGQRTNIDTHYKRKPNRGKDYTTITPRKTYRADL